MKKPISYATLTLLVIAFLILPATDAHPSTSNNRDTSSTPASASISGLSLSAVYVNKPVSNPFTTTPPPSGASGSGWRPDVAAAATTGPDLGPAIATYVNPSTGTTHLWVSAINASSTASPGGQLLNVFESTNGGVSWFLNSFLFCTGGCPVSFGTTSISVNNFNETVIAVADAYFAGVATAILTGLRTGPSGPLYSTGCCVFIASGAAGTIHDPSISYEYEYGSANYAYVAWDNGVSGDIRVSRSVNFGKTWDTPITVFSGALPGLWYYVLPKLDNAGGEIYLAAELVYYPGVVSTGFDENIVEMNVLWPGWPSATGTCFTLGNPCTFNFNATAAAFSFEPSIAVAHGPYGSAIIAYAHYNGATDDVYYTYTTNTGMTWNGGLGSLHAIAVTPGVNNLYPQATEDCTGQSPGGPFACTGGNFDVIYSRIETVGSRINGIYFTSLPTNDLPCSVGGFTICGYVYGWSTPQGQVADATAKIIYYMTGITAFPHSVTGCGVTTWVEEPGIVWTDYRNFGTTSYDVMFTAPGEDICATIFPNPQVVWAGYSATYQVTISLLSGPLATAYLQASGIYIVNGPYEVASFSANPITPTATTLLTIMTTNLIYPIIYPANVGVTIGGYKRFFGVTTQVVAPDLLTLSISPLTWSQAGTTITISGGLTSGGSPIAGKNILIFFRPHCSVAPCAAWAGNLVIATTTAGGTYSLTATFTTQLAVGTYDLVTAYYDSAVNRYAASNIVTVTVTT